MTSAEMLKSLVDRLERNREEKKAFIEHERDLFLEAKKGDFDCKAIRRVLQRRALGDAAVTELDGIVATYEAALGGKALAAEMLRGGATVRQAAKAAGVSVGTAHRQRSKTRVSDQTPKSSAATTVASPLPGAVVPSPQAALDTEDDAGWEAKDAAANYDVAIAAQRERHLAEKGADDVRRAAIQRTVALAAGAAPDDLQIPAHLRIGSVENDAIRRGPRQTAEVV